MGNENCPVCKKPIQVNYKPFCSKRCADVDLGRWFNHSYTIPGEEMVIDDPYDEEDISSL